MGIAAVVPGPIRSDNVLAQRSFEAHSAVRWASVYAVARVGDSSRESWAFHGSELSGAAALFEEVVDGGEIDSMPLPVHLHEPSQVSVGLLPLHAVHRDSWSSGGSVDEDEDDLEYDTDDDEDSVETVPNASGSLKRQVSAADSRHVSFSVPVA